ncbi:MAG: FGGY family carbohydrate kinase [Bacteroidia bacterium]|nr:FGGY family carbohydrate kinase [Bacteroidia bacterium]MDW8014988.1 FGGY family carbohydrate kinase [Bacteroidia bacterium]
MKNLLLAIDEGTSSARAIIFSLRGEILGLGRRRIQLHYPRPGWVEQEPEEIWEAQYEAVKEAFQTAGVSATDIAAVGITNQRETIIAWDDRTGRPYGRAIVWQDRRTTPICEQLQSHAAFIREKTGLVIDPYFSAPKIKWLLEEGGVPPSAQFGTVDAWLLYKLVGQSLTDVSNAARTLLFSLHTLQWDSDLLTLFGLEGIRLPSIRSTNGFFGETRLWGSPLPIYAVVGDQQAALYGHGAHRPGQAKNTYGTGCFILKNIGHIPLPAPKGILTTVAWQCLDEPPVYAWEAAIFNAAAALQWLEQLGLLLDYGELDSLDGSAGDVFFVPAFTGLGTPYWDPYARGLIIGLTRETDRRTLLLAALESLAYQSADALQEFGEVEELYVDGGVSVNSYLMQLQADLIGRAVVRPIHGEVTAWGAAALAAKGAGLRAESLPIERRWLPSGTPPSLHRWHEAVRRAQGWAKLS